MAIRLPLQTIGQFTETNELGTNSVAGGIAHPFQLPLDTDNVVVKFTSSMVSGGASAIFQTSDDGGVTYYDVARTSIVSNAGATTGTAQWLSIPVLGYGMTGMSSVVATGSIIGFGATIGAAAASSLGSRQMSGLPILGIQNRVFIVLSGNTTSATSNVIVTTVSANNVSASHN